MWGVIEGSGGYGWSVVVMEGCWELGMGVRGLWRECEGLWRVWSSY